MKIGTVTGAVWATRKAFCLAGQTFLVIRTATEELVAADQVGAGPAIRCCSSPAHPPAATVWTHRWMPW